MHLQQDQPDQSTTLLARLEDTACSFCDDGRLVREEYKGNAAVVCTNCGTPAAQIWNEETSPSDATTVAVSPTDR
ncbi:HVO_A0556 family zinc finger protein [Natrinema halophilum]|uniref:Small CPxCG-related zinc finger protein n=1 Tax=Natrinema halophilum TaxID=1699371 RepID=A0A7D5H2A2_9EURY|nr:HVO_A0556 family zinc finger protein [Natrinema halophilum]QLG48931.1 hypothetical protein HYG82_08740 [Natrinema halophilum]